MTLLPVVVRSIPSETKTVLNSLGRLDALRHHSLVMQLVFVGLMLVLLMLKPKLQLCPLVLLLRSSFSTLAMCPLLILLRKPLIK